MASAKRALAPDLGPDEAKHFILQLDSAEARRRIERAISEANPIALSRQIWGHARA